MSRFRYYYLFGCWSYRWSPHASSFKVSLWNVSLMLKYSLYQYNWEGECYEWKYYSIYIHYKPILLIWRLIYNCIHYLKQHHLYHDFNNITKQKFHYTCSNVWHISYILRQLTSYQGPGYTINWIKYRDLNDNIEK